jgi:hypothetical protein
VIKYYFALRRKRAKDIEYLTFDGKARTSTSTHHEFLRPLQR